MDFSPRILAFLEHEMKEIKNDPTRSGADRKHASTVLGRIEGELEWEAEHNLNGSDETPELFP